MITYKEAVKIVDEGEAEPALIRFMGFARQLMIRVGTGQIEYHQTADDTLIMVALIHRLLATPEGKRVLKKNHKGKSYDVLKLFGFPSPEFDIGMMLLRGLITRDAALKRLQDQLGQARDMYPDRKTLKSILNDLVEYSETMLRHVDLMGMAAGWDQDVRSAFSDETLLHRKP